MFAVFGVLIFKLYDIIAKNILLFNEMRLFPSKIKKKKKNALKCIVSQPISSDNRKWTLNISDTTPRVRTERIRFLAEDVLGFPKRAYATAAIRKVLRLSRL